MRNTFLNHPDELSSFHEPELSYQPKKLKAYGYWDKAELPDYVVPHNFT